MFVFVYLASPHLNVFVLIAAASLLVSFLFAVFCSPFVSLEPTDVGQKLQRMQPFFLLLAIVCVALAVIHFLRGGT